MKPISCCPEIFYNVFPYAKQVAIISVVIRRYFSEKEYKIIDEKNGSKRGPCAEFVGPAIKIFIALKLLCLREKHNPL